jgi:acetyltransferase-like isoleucine patch superfamily enzyme
MLLTNYNYFLLERFRNKKLTKILIEMEENKDTFPINEKEVMDYYGYSGNFGRLKIKFKFLKSWILHSLAYSSPLSSFSISMQRSRGVKIGENCHFNPYVLIDLIYPKMVEIQDNVTLGSNSMIFAHSNPSANLFLKQGEFPRKISKVVIKTGAVINPGAIIIAGVTIGENSIISPRSVVTQDIPDYCIAVGNPARVIKKINH